MAATRTTFLSGILLKTAIGLRRHVRPAQTDMVFLSLARD